MVITPKEIKHFTEWVAENHFHLYDIIKGIHYWKSESETLTTEQLYKRYKKHIDKFKDAESHKDIS